MADAGEGPRKLRSRKCASAPTKKAPFHPSLERGYMKAATIVGIVLVIIGVISLAYQGITYTTHKKAVDIGSLEISREEKKTIPLPPVLGALALVGGIALIAVGARKRS